MFNKGNIMLSPKLDPIKVTFSILVSRGAKFISRQIIQIEDIYIPAMKGDMYNSARCSQ